jgi:ATP-binding cassette subfamily F protein 3
MPIASLSGVSVAFGARTLLDSINLTVGSGTRMALVGPNGSGKTTLLKVLAGATGPDNGSVVVEKGTRISYVPQSVAEVSHGKATLREQAEKAFEWGHELVAETRALEDRLGAVSSDSKEAESILWRHHALRERLEGSGYYGREETVQRVFTGLGFAREDPARPCASFSAGWQMRIALACAILEMPDILLLDEPTNYLDLEARAWLEDFLRSFTGGFVVVSHDRYFLDVVSQSVAEIYLARVSVFKGNYSDYEKARGRELEAIMERYARQQEEIARIEAFVHRFRYNASKARLVQSRVKYLESLERIEVPPVQKAVHFSFPPPPHCGRIVLEATDLAKSYDGKSVFTGVGIDLARGEKLVVVGVNGAGKSTLLRLLSGREEPDSGSLRWGKGVISAFFSQENADSWASEKQVIEEVESAAPTSLVPELRTLLGAFLFRGDDIYKSVSVLSGGEKSRLAMLMLLLKPANILILDEPTNHLDLSSQEILLAALRQFSGTVVFVSHDRHFIGNLATAVLELKSGHARLFPGDYEYYQRRAAQETIDENGSAVMLRRDATGAPANDRSETAVQRERLEEKRLKSLLRAVERQEQQLLAQLESLEGSRREIEEEMARPEVYADGDRMRKLRRSHEDAQREHDSAMGRWEELAAEANGLKERIAGLRSDRDGL